MEVFLDGESFNNLETFYNQIENILTKNLDWKIGRNLDAFNDVLRGGFGVHDYHEHLTLIWINSEKSRQDLGKEETLKYFLERIQNCHPTNIPHFKQQAEALNAGTGETLFDIIIQIFKENQNIDLILR